MDMGFTPDIQESFKIFQGKIMEQYEKMISEYDFVVIDATLPVEEQQQQVRQAIRKKLEDAKKVRVRRWLQLSHSVRGYRD